MIKNLFIIDPLEQITKKLLSDSSTLLMQEGLARGHEIFIATLSDLLLTSTFLKVKCQKVTAITEKSGYHLKNAEEQFAHEFQVIWLRKNPPFDETYLMHLALFDKLSAKQVLFINNPRSIRELNEKLTIFYFPEYIVETLVTSKEEEIYNFWKQHGEIVVKGLTGFAGDSVILVKNWKNDLKKLRTVSQKGKRFLMVQKFIENIYLGDKRVSIVNGKVAGALVRIPAKGSFIAYTGAGATVEKTTLNPREMLIAKKVAKFLKANNIFWAGIDLIDGYLSEINITSPSLLALANRTLKIHLEKTLWNELEKVCSKRYHTIKSTANFPKTS